MPPESLKSNLILRSERKTVKFFIKRPLNYYCQNVFVWFWTLAEGWVDWLVEWVRVNERALAAADLNKREWCIERKGACARLRRCGTTEALKAAIEVPPQFLK